MVAIVDIHVERKEGKIECKEDLKKERRGRERECVCERER